MKIVDYGVGLCGNVEYGVSLSVDCGVWSKFKCRLWSME